jgi:PleD family two-component response regulator
MRALLLDDRKTTEKALGRSLRRAGFEVLLAAEDRSAMKFLQESGPVDLVLVNWNLDRGEGPRFVRFVRSQRQFDSLRLIMRTAALDLPSILEAVRLGVDEFLILPVTNKKVLQKLENLRFPRERVALAQGRTVRR